MNPVIDVSWQMVDEGSGPLGPLYNASEWLKAAQISGGYLIRVLPPSGPLTPAALDLNYSIRFLADEK